MYCITTNTLCTTENNVSYSALTDWLSRKYGYLMFLRIHTADNKEHNNDLPHLTGLKYYHGQYRQV